MVEFQERKLWNDAFSHLTLEQKIEVLQEQLLLTMQEVREAVEPNKFHEDRDRDYIRDCVTEDLKPFQVVFQEKIDELEKSIICSVDAIKKKIEEKGND